MESARPPMNARAMERAVERAINLPAGLDSNEHASWILRGLCEAALFGIAQAQPIDPIDEAVDSLTCLRRGDPRFASRLVNLRLIYGRAPGRRETSLLSSYGALGRDWSQTRPPTPRPANTEAFCRLADLIDRNGSVPSDRTVSAADGYGRDALVARETWRPGGLPTTRVRFVASTLDPSLAWRVWTCGEDGAPIIVLLSEMLHPTVHDIWWGVHNGTHLDHITHLVADGQDPTVIEYGEGLLLAESLAMTVELLAGLENSNLATARVVWDGLVERLARIPLPRLASSPTAVAARSAPNTEFASLPTLAAAYTIGSIDLLATGFNDPLIPTPYREALRERWDRLVAQRSDVEEILRGLG